MDPKNTEFVALIQTAGWSQAETARRLQISTASVSQICTGKIRPSNSTLNLLKLMIAGEKPDALKFTKGPILPPWASDLVAELQRVSDQDREKLLPLMHQMIRAVASPAAKPKKAQS